MNKKNLPKAIRPTATTSTPGAAAPDPKLSARPVGPPYAPGKAEAATAEETTSPDAAKTLAKHRRAVAVKLVERFAWWSGAAGLIPVPLVDLAAVGGVQIQMLRRISQIYEVPFSANRSKALVASLAGSMIPLSSGIGAASIVKGVPLLGPTISAFLMPALSAGATYAIGMVFIQHFASGGTLLDFDPTDYREFIKAQKVMWSNQSAKSAQPPNPGAPRDLT